MEVYGDTYQGLVSDLRRLGVFHNRMGCILARVDDRPDEDDIFEGAIEP